MASENEALAEILPDIRRAANHVALEWADVVGAEDIQQEISVRLLEDSYATVVQSLDPRARRKTLFKIGQQIASEERVDYEHFTGQYRYSTDEVRERLDKGALAGVSEVDLGSIAGEKAGTFSVEDIDIREAYTSLPKNHRRVLLERFVFNTHSGYPIEITRAVGALTHELNREFRRGWADHDGPGARKAVSNAKAQYLLGFQEEKG